MLFGGKGKKEKEKKSSKKRPSHMKLDYEYYSPEQLEEMCAAEIGGKDQLKEYWKMLAEGMQDAMEAKQNKEHEIQRPPGYKWKNKAK